VPQSSIRAGADGFSLSKTLCTQGGLSCQMRISTSGRNRIANKAPFRLAQKAAGRYRAHNCPICADRGDIPRAIFCERVHCRGQARWHRQIKHAISDHRDRLFDIRRGCVSECVWFSASDNGRTLLFKCGPASSHLPLPTIEVPDQHTIIIAVPIVSDVVFQRDDWNDHSIRYDIGRINFPPPR
jgi:hypothetical protein